MQFLESKDIKLSAYVSPHDKIYRVLSVISAVASDCLDSLANLHTSLGSNTGIKCFVVVFFFIFNACTFV